jgi:hypothetical protein
MSSIQQGTTTQQVMSPQEALLRVTMEKWAHLPSFQQQQQPTHSEVQIAQQQLQQEQQ